MPDKPFLGLRTVIYSVNDLKKAKDWYTKILDIKPYFDQPFYVGFEVAGYELGLQPDENEDAPRGTNEIVYWGVPDIQQAYRRLLELDALAHEAPQNVGGDIMTAVVLDPWGNPFGLIYNPSFETG